MDAEAGGDAGAAAPQPTPPAASDQDVPEDESDDESDEDDEDDAADDADADAADDAADGDDRPASRLEVEGDIAADYLEELLDIADLDGDIDTYVEGGRAQVSIVTEGDQLVGKNGEVLDALQELARLVVMTETDHRSRLMLDIAGHRDRRRSELTILAKDAIAEVKQSGEAVRLAPMNPFERKIIHDLVAEAGLVSESEGVEPKRRVVILP
ncbi:protein jag [Tessaracoccus sp. SD287]|nr:protein jag [Tessaracoccus sp. SD287]